MKATLGVICVAAILWGCSKAQDEKKVAKRASETRPTTLPNDPAPSAAEIARTYKTLVLMTPEPKLVSAQISLLCAPSAPPTVEGARKTFGPHANTRVSIFMNERAATSFRKERPQSPTYPIGSIIVKQKQSGGVGGMIKRSPGYDAEHGDWEYFYFENPGKIESGKVSSCVNCPAGAMDTDHVFGSWASAD